MKLRKIIASFLSAAVMMAIAPAAYALDADNVEPWERSAETHRENLGSSIAYLEVFDTSAYTEESVNALKEAIETAKTEFEDGAQTAEYYYNARNQLEYARAKLVYSSIGEDGPNRLPFRELSAEELIAEMGAGINFGNTMDGHSSMVPSETAGSQEQPQRRRLPQCTTAAITLSEYP